MTEYLQQEYLNSGSALVQSFKDGTRYVTKKSVQEIHPMVKDHLAAFVREHPEVLEAYKQIKGAEGPLDNDDFSWLIERELFDESAFARALIDRLRAIPTGSDTATEFHNIIMGICTFLFYPRLAYPIKEHEIHAGRKRIDIKYTNTATRGFFFRMLENHNTRSIDIPMECKNYSADIGNDALDQLSGRFSLHRGRIGFLLCRELNNRNLFVQRCGDTVADNRGYIIVLEDSDIIEMLEYIRGNNRGMIDNFLQNRFGEIT